jgi:hypothetical protein
MRQEFDDHEQALETIEMILESRVAEPDRQRRLLELRRAVEKNRRRTEPDAESRRPPT